MKKYTIQIIQFRLILLMLFNFYFIANIKATTDSIIQLNYELAFTNLKKMHNQNQTSFEDAMFLMENAWHDNQLNYAEYETELDEHTLRIALLADANKERINKQSVYTINGIESRSPEEVEKNNQEVLLNWAIYTYITDTTWWKVGDEYVPNYPITYANEDPYGKEDWKISMVTNLLDKESTYKQANCFSLATLYYIFSQRLQSQAFLSTAPQHIFIQHKGFDGFYYNVELTTHTFPGTGTIKTCTYTTHDAVLNGISMRRLTEKESIALCLVYLAKGYERRLSSLICPKDSFGERGAETEIFSMKCAELALQFDSLCLSALLLKAQILERQYIKEMQGQDDFFQNADSTEVGQSFFQLQQLGYCNISKAARNLFINENDKFITYHTLSNYKFPELFSNHNQHPVDIYNTQASKKTLDPTMFALSIDPLAAKYASLSPYNAMGNNPITMIDPDGRSYLIAWGLIGQKIKETITAESAADVVNADGSPNAAAMVDGMLYTAGAGGLLTGGVIVGGATLELYGVISGGAFFSELTFGVGAGTMGADLLIGDGMVGVQMSDGFHFVNESTRATEPLATNAEIDFNNLNKTVKGGFGRNTQGSCPFFAQTLDHYLATGEIHQSLDLKNDGLYDALELLFANGTHKMYANSITDLEKSLLTLSNNSRGAFRFTITKPNGQGIGHLMNWIVRDGKVTFLDAGNHITGSANDISNIFSRMGTLSGFQSIKTGTIGDGIGN